MTDPTTDRLARLADHMTAALEQAPERGEERAIILLHDPDGTGVLHAHGYDDDLDAREELLDYTRAMYFDRGLILLVTRPSELAALFGAEPGT